MLPKFDYETKTKISRRAKKTDLFLFYAFKS